MMNITLRQLDYFLALARTRHFGRAAAACHVTQPALSTQIREMEARLGTPLVERAGRGVILTPAGEAVREAAAAIRAELERLEAAVARRVGLDGRLRLGVIPTVAPYLLPVALPILRAGRRQLDLRVREAQTAELLAALADGRLDAAVMALPAGPKGLAERPLCRDRFLLAGSSAELQALCPDGRAPAPATLDPARLLLLDEGHCLADQALEVCGLDRAGRATDLGAASLATLARLAAEGFGLTLLPEMARRAETAAAPGLATRPFRAPEPGRLVGLVGRPAARGAPWFEELAALLARATAALVATPPFDPAPAPDGPMSGTAGDAAPDGAPDGTSDGAFAATPDPAPETAQDGGS